MPHPRLRLLQPVVHLPAHLARLQLLLPAHPRLRLLQPVVQLPAHLASLQLLLPAHPRLRLSFSLSDSVFLFLFVFDDGCYLLCRRGCLLLHAFDCCRLLFACFCLLLIALVVACLYIYIYLLLLAFASLCLLLLAFTCYCPY